MICLIEEDRFKNVNKSQRNQTNVDKKILHHTKKTF